MNASTNRMRLGGLGRWLAAAIVALGAAPGLAQQQAGGDGRALDANQQVGSGGTNAPRDQLDFRVRNDVVTGNVGGGRSFRDGVGYGAPGEFGDVSGTDDLFPFRRDAYSPGRPAGLPGGGGSVYRTYTAPNTARPLLRPGQDPSPWIIDSYGASDGRLNLRAFDGTRSPDTFDRLQFDDMGGQWLEVSASPLLGVRSDVRQPDLFDRWRDGPAAPDADDPLQQREEDLEIDRSLRRSNLLDLRAYQLSAGIGTMEDDLYRSPRSAPTLLLGQQLRSQLLTPEQAERARAAGDERMSRLEEQMFQPLQSVRSVEPGEDPYLDLLSQMRGDEAVDAQERDLARQADDDDAEEADDDPFRVPEIDEQDREVDDLPGRDPELEALRSRAEELIDQLDYDLPPLETLAGEGEGRRNRLMSQAEQMMTEGQFFEAEGMYREIVTREAEAPLARVGLAHAQLGAGMIRSAAMNLRTLFEQHPELIAAQYEARLLPPADRLDWLQGELRRMIDEPRHNPAEAGLVLAYLGYQIGEPAVVEEGLDAVHEGAQRDALEPVLRQIWLDQPVEEGQ
ncbi:MAG: hypothetical protein WDZ31_04840 [Phycisphaeraceae bacterium]